MLKVNSELATHLSLTLLLHYLLMLYLKVDSANLKWSAVVVLTLQLFLPMGSCTHGVQVYMELSDKANNK